MPVKIDDAARAAMLKAQAEAREAARRAELARQRAAQKAAQAAAQKAAQAAAKAAKPEVNRVKRDLSAPQNLDLASAIKRDFSQAGALVQKDLNQLRSGFESGARNLGFGLFAGAKMGGYSAQDFAALKSHAVGGAPAGAASGAPSGAADDPGLMPVKDAGERNVPLEYQRVEGTLVTDAIDPNDIEQGSLGDCWYLATIASMAKVNPDAIKNRIRDNGDGTYTVTFQKPPFFDQLKDNPNMATTGGGLATFASALHLLPRGGTVQVTVDGDLPVMPDRGGGLAYGRDREMNELWVPIMEKAYAKLWGSYDKIGNGGVPATAMYMLTGQSVSDHGLGPTSDANAVFADLQEASRNNEMLVAGTSGTPKVPLMAGLEGPHAYTILGVSEEGGEKYVQLRNPWAHGEPGYDGEDDGVFKITAKEFCQNFTYYNRGELK